MPHLDNKGLTAKALAISGIAALYVMFSQLGLLLAIPPGYVTVIWPSSGIALAGILLLGRSASFGVFFGSFLTNMMISAAGQNFELSFDASEGWFAIIAQLEPLLASVPLAAIIALGAALQALVGGHLIHRRIAPPFLLTDLRSTLIFMALSGPISCLINATIGAGALLGFGVITGTGFASSWFTWWVGDSMGALVFTPIMLSVFHFGEAFWKSRRLSLALPMIVTFSLVSLFFMQTVKWEKEHQSLEFKQQAKGITDAIGRSFASYANTLKALQVTIEATGGLGRQEFQKVAKFYRNGHKGLHAISFNRLVKDQDRAAFVADMRAAGFADFAIKDKTPAGLVPAAKATHYVVVDYIEPFADNEKALGLNIYAHPKRRMAIEAAIKQKAPVATPKIKLVQGNIADNGILMINPVFRGAPAEIFGFVVGVFKVDKLIAENLRDVDLGGTAIHIFDFANNEVLYTSQPSGLKTTNLEHFEAKKSYIDPWLVPIAFGGRTLTLVVEKTNEALLEKQSWSLWFSLVAGLFFVVILAAFLITITGRASAIEKIVSQRTRDLEKAKDKAIRSEAVKSQFLANMSHEIRTPLNGIIGLGANLLEVAESPDLVRETAMTINACADTLLVVVNDVLDFSKLESGKIKIANTAFSLPETTKKCVELYKAKIARQNLKINITISEQTPDYIMGDPQRFFQILSNLFSNALKFSSNGTITIAIESQNHQANATNQQAAGATVDDGDHNLNLQVAVHDEGIGIPEDQIDILFNDFVQVDSSESRAFGGTGLGLSICKKLVETMKGHIWVTSKLDVGSSFYFAIPTRAAKNNEIPAPTCKLDENKLHFDPNRLNVLVVDDNQINRKLAAGFLTKLHLKVTTASNGREAIAKMAETTYNVVFMDMQMPIMGGIEATKILRQTFSSQEVKIIAITANVLEQQKQICYAAGMDDFIAKPMLKKDFINVLNRLMASDWHQKSHNAS